MLVSELQKTSVSPQRVFKVVFLGSSGVGKTSFIRRFCTGQPQERVNATVGELCCHSHPVFSVTETHKEPLEPRRDRLPDEDFNRGLHHRHSAAVGHSRPGKVSPTHMHEPCFYFSQLFVDFYVGCMLSPHTLSCSVYSGSAALLSNTTAEQTASWPCTTWRAPPPSPRSEGGCTLWRWARKDHVDVLDGKQNMQNSLSSFE